MKKVSKRPHWAAFHRKWWQLIVLVLAFSSAVAQSDQTRYMPIQGYGFKYKRIGIDSVLMIPLFDSPHTPYRAGAIKYRTSDSSLYKWTGTQWLKVNESAVTTDGIDSIHIYTAADPDPDTLYQYNGGDSSLVGYIPKVGSASALTTIVRRPLDVLAGDSAMGISDTVTLKYGYGLTATASDTTLVVDTSVIATIDTAFAILTRGMTVVDTIQFIHTGSGVSTYQNNKLIGSKLLSLSLENYPVGFISRSTSVWMAFDPGTGIITLTNGEFAADDLVLILYRTYTIFLVDGNGDLVTDSNGNYIIVN